MKVTHKSASGPALPGPPGSPPAFRSKRRGTMANSPHLPALGASGGGGVGRGAQSRTRVEWVTWAKRNSLVKKSAPMARGTSASSRYHSLTFSLEPPKPLCRTVCTAPTPLEAGLGLFNMAAPANLARRAWRTGSQEGLETPDSTISAQLEFGNFRQEDRGRGGGRAAWRGRGQGGS